MTTEALTRIWPAAGLRVRAGDLELRWIDDALLVELAELAGRGVHAESTMPFAFPWTRGSATQVAHRVLDYQWRNRSALGPDRLVLELGVLWNGRPVGIQGASGSDWSVLREVETGSWLGREFQGRGIGARMRAMILHLFFEGLDAENVTSAAYLDNPASNAVSRKTGYEQDGIVRVAREGQAAMQHRYRMTRERWAAVREANAALVGAPIEMSGVAPVAEHLRSDRA